jgi:RNA polymerase primary sigma factor
MRSSLQKYLDDIADAPVLTQAEEASLIIAAKGGDEEAAKRILAANMRYVVVVARKYSDSRMMLADLIGEGNLGLFRAIRSFDPRRGFRFVTYAQWWVRHCITSAVINKFHTIRIPKSQLRLRRASEKEKLKNAQKKGVFQADDSAGSSGRYVKVVSLFSELNSDDGDMLINLIPDVRIAAPDSELLSESARVELRNSMAKLLKKREAEILRLLFGIGHDRRYKLSEVGEMYGISKERVRQIREAAFKKLRCSEESGRLKQMLD